MNYFLTVIQNLRQQEEIVLYGNILTVDESEETEVIELLRKEFIRESWHYPFVVPTFDPGAALWAAKSIYLAAQLILYRENKDSDLGQILPVYTEALSPSAILSADLCLRFLPDMIVQLKLIDPEDPLINLLETTLTQWHFSGITYSLEATQLNFTAITSDKCLHQLYVNRIIEYKKLHLAKLPSCQGLVSASLGMFAYNYWNEFKTAISINE